MKTFGSAPPPSSSTAARPVAAATPTPPAAPQQPAPPPARHGFGGGGLPPPDPNAPSGGFGEKRDAAYWADHPPRPGNHTWDCYVSKIVWWIDGAPSLTLRVTQWDRAANRPGDDHGRDIRFDQGPGKRTGGAFNAWRADIVGAYTAGGWPEDSWAKDPQSGHPAPPWHDFWTHQCGDGMIVPVLLTVAVTVTPPSNGGFVNVKKIGRVTLQSGGFVQAPMPFELPPDLAEYHRWPHGDQKTIQKDGRTLAVVVPMAKDAVPLGHLGMTTYKDL